MTKRIIEAVKNPHMTILGHPTGRLLLRREGYMLDIKKSNRGMYCTSCCY